MPGQIVEHGLSVCGAYRGAPAGHHVQNTGPAAAVELLLRNDSGIVTPQAGGAQFISAGARRQWGLGRCVGAWAELLRKVVEEGFAVLSRHRSAPADHLVHFLGPDTAVELLLHDDGGGVAAEA